MTHQSAPQWSAGYPVATVALRGWRRWVVRREALRDKESRSEADRRRGGRGVGEPTLDRSHVVVVVFVLTTRE